MTAVGEAASAGAPGVTRGAVDTHVANEGLVAALGGFREWNRA